METRTRRRVRTALVGGALAVLTLAGHLAGGGAADPLGTLLVTALALGLGWAVSARTLPLGRLLAVLLAGQAFLHLVLTFSAGHSHSAGSLSTATMVAAHVTAAVVAAVVVRNADGLVDRWSALLAATIGAAQPQPALPAAVSAPLADASAPAHPRLLHLEHRVHRRGPPARLVLLPA